MALVHPQDCGTGLRGRMTPAMALRAWENTGGVCVICNRQIEGTKADWFVEHIRALELGGADERANLGPAHYACKPIKDAADHSAAAEAKRQKRALLGISERPYAGKLKGQGFKPGGRQHSASRIPAKIMPRVTNPFTGEAV